MTDPATATGGRRTWRRHVASALAAAALLVGGLVAGCSARDADPEAAAAVIYSETAPVKSGLMSPMEDWHHLRQVLGYLRTTWPKRPPVYLMGGSSTRECTINDLNWRRQIVESGGPQVWAFNLGSSNQSFDHEIEMVRQLPAVPSLVLIGINLGRYCWKPPTDWGVRKMVLKDEGTVIKPYAQHRFVYDHIAADSKKREMAYQWLDERGPEFNAYFRYNAGRLAALVSVCKQRGFRPVIVNMPWNMATVGHLHDAYRTRMARNAQNVAERYAIPYVDWIPDIDFVSRDFMDNAHLVEPGRIKYQRRLSLLVVRLCHRYRISAVPRPTASPATAASPTSSPAESPAPSSSSTVAP